MTPASQEVVSGEVLSEHVCGVLVSCHKVQSDLSIADFLTDIMEANINMLCLLLLDWVRGIKDCSLIISTQWDRIYWHPKLFQKRAHPHKLSASVR
jgi:hypothetical protein